MPFALSMTTDYVASQGCPEPYLRGMAAAGIRHIHWCHQWNTDFLYGPAEIDQIERWLREFDLSLHDLHATQGMEKSWLSTREYERQAGVELVRNRLEMAQRLSCPIIIMHVPKMPKNTPADEAYLAPLYRSLDELEPTCRRHRMRIAFENSSADYFDLIERILRRYGPDYVGVCYDSGHGHIAGNGLDRLERVKDRLLVLHLHDNNATADQHKIVFTGTVGWPRLARIIATSGYDRPAITHECVMRDTGISDEAAFLQQVVESHQRLAEMIEQARPVTLQNRGGT